MLESNAAMKRTLIILFALAALAVVASPAAGFQRTYYPEDELQWAQRDYREGTNCTARGMFREADSTIGGSISNVTRRLRETEQRARTVEPLQGFVDRLQAVRDRIEDDWTNAVREALALEAEGRSRIRKSVRRSERMETQSPAVTRRRSPHPAAVQRSGFDRIT